MAQTRSDAGADGGADARKAAPRGFRPAPAAALLMPALLLPALLAVPTTAGTAPASWGPASWSPASVSLTSSHLGVSSRVPPAGDPVVVSLGDSYISGQAGRWAGNSDDFLFDRAGTDRAWSVPKGKIFGRVDRSRVYGATATNGCFRSDSAPIMSAVKVGGLALGRPVNLACSGAKAANVLRAGQGGVGLDGEKPQDDQLAALARTSRVRLIEVSIGGNDLGFPQIVERCVTAYSLHRGSCKTAEQPTIEAALPTMATAVGKVLDDVRATMSAAGYGTGDYRLVLQSYPNPLPSADQDKYSGHWRAFKSAGGRCPFTDPDETWTARTVTPEVTAVLHQAARQHGAAFLDLSNAFAGHELCAAGTTHPHGTPKIANSEWVRFVDLSGQGDGIESLHPNYFGQQAVGQCIAYAVRSGGDQACTGTRGKGLDGVTVSSAAG